MLCLDELHGPTNLCRVVQAERSSDREGLLQDIARQVQLGHGGSAGLGIQRRRGQR